MSNYLTLMGAEEVSSAAHRMSEAASTMNSAAIYMDNVLERHQHFLDDWLMRFEAAVCALQAEQS